MPRTTCPFCKTLRTTCKCGWAGYQTSKGDGTVFVSPFHVPVVGHITPAFAGSDSDDNNQFKGRARKQAVEMISPEAYR